MDFISNNLKHLRHSKNLTQANLGIALGVTRARISSYEEGRSHPGLGYLAKFSDYFNITIDALIKIDLTKTKDYSFIETTNNRILFPMLVDDDNSNLIELVPVQASAGYLLGYNDPEYVEELEKIKLPFLPTGKHRAFPIKGDSMLPMKSGSFVVGRYIEDLHNITNGKTYILITRNDGLVYKRIYNQIETSNSLLLVSDNKSYDSYELPIEDIMELWEFTCSINTQEYDEHELKISSIITMFTELGIELKALEKLLP